MPNWWKYMSFNMHPCIHSSSKHESLKVFDCDLGKSLFLRYGAVMYNLEIWFWYCN